MTDLQINPDTAETTGAKPVATDGALDPGTQPEDATTEFEPRTLPNGATLAVRPSHVEVAYSEDPKNAPRTELGPQVVYTDANGDCRTVDCDSVADAEALATTAADIAYLLNVR